MTTPRFDPAGRAARKLVILLHGYGANGNDLIDLGRAWAERLPRTAFVAPHAPEPCTAISVPGGSARQWFALDTSAPIRDPDELWEELTEAAPALDQVIDEELARYGLHEPDTALVGFSQGTMMALHCAPRRGAALAGVLGYSGALAGAGHLSADVKSRPSIFLVHGDADPVVPVAASIAAANHLGGAGIPTQYHLCPGLGHGIDPAGLALGGAFLARALSFKR